MGTGSSHGGLQGGGDIPCLRLQGLQASCYPVCLYVAQAFVCIHHLEKTLLCCYNFFLRFIYLFT